VVQRTVANRIVAAVLASALSSGTAIGPATRQSATGSVTISKPISASRTGVLNFGQFRTAGGDNCAPSTITLDPRTGALSTTGDVILLGGAPAFASYAISGSANSIYGMSFPGLATSSPHALSVRFFRFYSVTNKSTTMGRIGFGGTDTPQVGATLSVPCRFNTRRANETVPAFTLTVTYQ
jgi:hypothetical protein